MSEHSAVEYTRSEIREGPAVVEAVWDDQGALSDIGSELAAADRLYFLGCGSSYWTGEIIAASFRARGVDARTVQSSEFLFTNHRTGRDTIAVGLSQSGETTETVRALEHADEQGASTVALTNSAESSLATVADRRYITPAGTEHAVLATKSVNATVAAGALLVNGDNSLALKNTVEGMQTALQRDVTAAADLFDDANRAYTVGSRVRFGLAGEAATKLGEGPLVQTTPLPGLEITHGPISNAAGVPVVLFTPVPSESKVFEKLLTELDDAGAQTLVVGPGADDFEAHATIPLPNTGTVLPSLTVLQRLTLNLSKRRGLNPDSPPQLSKHVEWEQL